MKNLITLTVFEYPFQAQVIKSKLESEDIYVFLKDELTIQIDNFLSNAIGGVKLQVYENDVEKSLEILKLFDVTIYKHNKPEDFATKFDASTKNIPLIGKIPLVNRGIFLIVFGLIITISITIFIVSLKV